MKKLLIIDSVDLDFLTSRKDIALAAQEAGYEVTIITKDTGRGKNIEDLGLKFIALPIDLAGTNLITEFKTLFFLYRTYRRVKPDIIHHFGIKLVLWGGLAAKLAKSKGIVNTITGLGFLFSEENIQSFRTNLIISVLRYSHNRRNFEVIFQNLDDKKLFIDLGIIGEYQCEVIKGSGIDLDVFNFAPEPEDMKIKIVFISRMIKDKGIFEIVDAANKLRSDYGKKIVFLFCGDIDKNPNAISKDVLQKICDGEYISWLGYRNDIKDILINSHIFVLPSYYREGIPRSIIEASAIGRPIITTDSVGCKETVNDGYNGYLIPIKDSYALVESLLKLIHNKKLRKRFGMNSRKIAERDYSIKNVIDKHLKVYNQFSLSSGHDF